MCGIVGYCGKKDASDILIKGLKRLEYRGYDSCGISLLSEDGKIYLERVKGRVDVLKDRVSKRQYKNVVSGIAHTRWATHGVANEDNAHPHTDCSGEIVVVHNGIIENYIELKESLCQHNFKSDTDSEVIAHLIEENIKKIEKKEMIKAQIYHPIFFKAFLETVNILKGSFAIAVIYGKLPGVIFGARRFSPLVVGRGQGENFLSSDVSGFLEYTREVYFMEDNEIVFMDLDKVAFFDFSGKKLDKKSTTINWDIKMAERGGYQHFMLKEIFEEDISFENTIAGRVLPVGEYLLKKEMNITVDEIKKFSQINFVACGTAYHAAYVGKYLFEKLGIRSEIDLASEFYHRANVIDKNALVIAISQSGETADTIDALRIAKKNGNKILCVTNTVGSTITRESNYVIYTHCGPEIAVASTKAFIGQLAAIYILAINFAYIRGNILITKARQLSHQLLEMPKHMKTVLSSSQNIKNIVDRFENKNDYLFISRGINYPIALEGALKLKEISYLHAEGYASGEMKHGPIAIIDEGMPVIVIAPMTNDIELIRSNIEEVKARGGVVFAIVDSRSKKYIRPNYFFEIPDVDEYFTPILTAIPLQFFAYYTALKRGCDIDKPRNLAKSVTVK